MDSYSSALLGGGAFTCTPKWRATDWQYADCHRLYFPRRGRAEFLYRGRTVELRAGYIYLLPGYRWIRYRCARRMTLDWLHFRPDSMEMNFVVARFAGGLRWPAAKWSFWKPVYRRMQELFDARSPRDVCRTQAMLAWACAEWMALPAPADPPRGTGAPQAFAALKPALAFMDGHFLENPSLEDVAESVHLCPVYFHRCFKRTFSVTPHNYLVARRMNYAWSALAQGGVAVKEVAEKLRFGSPFYFSRAFKRHFGRTPIEVRMGRLPLPP